MLAKYVIAIKNGIVETVFCNHMSTSIYLLIESTLSEKEMLYILQDEVDRCVKKEIPGPFGINRATFDTWRETYWIQRTNDF
jgi:hypothetical protein